MPWLEIIGWIGSGLVVFSLTQARVLRFRWLNLIGSVIAAGYNAVIGIWPFFAMNAIIAVINVYWLFKLYRTRHDEAVYEVVEVSVDDAYRCHVHKTYAEDIAQYSPRFSSVLTDGEQRLSFLVVKGDELVGMVELRDEGDGTATVLLDWVVKKYRDFSPGEFVYRRSGIFAEHGFHRLILGDDVHPGERYLESAGFSTVDGRWVFPVPPTKIG